MGYTIYYEVKKVASSTENNRKKWANTLLKIQGAWNRIPETFCDDDGNEYHRPVLCGGSGSGKPYLKGDMICFNGNEATGEACEGFLFRPFAAPGLCEWFCKTRFEAYTIAVVIALKCINKYFNKSVEMHSDGDDKAIWGLADRIIAELDA